MSSEPKARGKRCMGTSGKRRGKPHNADLPDYESLAEMVEAIASEKRAVPTRTGEIVMSRRERTFRILIAKALADEDNVRDLAQVLRFMIKYPDMASTYETVIVIRGKMCDV